MITSISEELKRKILIICMFCVLVGTIFCAARDTLQQAYDFSNADYFSEMPIRENKSAFMALQSRQAFLVVSEVKDLREAAQKLTYGKQLSRNINASVILLVLYLIILFSLFLYIPCISLWREKALICEGLVDYIQQKDGKK